jgi:hypothetical protein
MIAYFKKKKISNILKNLMINLKKKIQFNLHKFNFWILISPNILFYFILEFFTLNIFNFSLISFFINYLYNTIANMKFLFFIFNFYFEKKKLEIIILFFSYIFFIFFIIYFIKTLNNFFKFIFPKLYFQFIFKIFYFNLIFNFSGFFNINFILNLFNSNSYFINKINTEFFLKKMNFQEYQYIIYRIQEYLIILNNNYLKTKSYNFLERQIVFNQILLIKNIIFNFNFIFKNGFIFNSWFIYMNKNNNLLFLKNYKIIEKIEDFFFINFILKKNLLKKKKLLKNFILNFNFLIKKINLNSNYKNNINFLLHKYYNINLDIFKDKKKINYINIYYLKIIIQKILLKNNLLINKQFYIELLQFINYNLSVLVYLNKLLNKINKYNLIIEYFYLGIDSIIKLELNKLNLRTNNYFTIKFNNFYYKNNKIYLFILNFIFYIYLIIIYIFKNIFFLNWALKIFNIINYLISYKLNFKVYIIKLKKLWNNV